MLFEVFSQRSDWLVGLLLYLFFTFVPLLTLNSFNSLASATEYNNFVYFFLWVCLSTIINVYILTCPSMRLQFTIP